MRGSMARATPCALLTPPRLRCSYPCCGGRRGRRFGLRSPHNREIRSRGSRISRLCYALRPVAPAPPPKSGVRSVLRTQRAFLSATAGTIPRRSHPAAESAVLGWGVSGTSPRLRVRWLPLSAPPPFYITPCAPLLCALRAHGGTEPPLAGPPPPARFRGARLRVARFSPSPPLSGQSGVPPCGRGLFLRLTLQGLTAGWAQCARVRWAGGALLSGRVAR